VLRLYRELAESDPATYRPDVATTLNNLAVLYSETQRLEEAESAFREALDLYRELAQKDPAVYQPKVSAILAALESLAEAKAKAAGQAS
jgi:tetratricopeptide (TPR) repeat protein